MRLFSMKCLFSLIQRSTGQKTQANKQVQTFLEKFLPVKWSAVKSDQAQNNIERLQKKKEEELKSFVYL